MKKILIIFFLLFGLGMPTAYYSQAGGRKKEGRTRKRGNFRLNQWKSQGHADQFARGNSGRRGIFARLFKKEKPSWRYRSSGSRRSHFKANQYLFMRNRTKGKVEDADFQVKQNKDRSRTRVRGNRVFKKRKYKGGR